MRPNAVGGPADISSWETTSAAEPSCVLKDGRGNADEAGIGPSIDKLCPVTICTHIGLASACSDGFCEKSCPVSAQKLHGAKPGAGRSFPLTMTIKGVAIALMANTDAGEDLSRKEGNEHERRTWRGQFSVNRHGSAGDQF